MFSQSLYREKEFWSSAADLILRKCCDANALFWLEVYISKWIFPIGKTIAW